MSYKLILRTVALQTRYFRRRELWDGIVLCKAVVHGLPPSWRDKGAKARRGPYYLPGMRLCSQRKGNNLIAWGRCHNLTQI